MLAKVLVIPYVSYVSKVFAEVKSAALFYYAVLNLSHLNIATLQVQFTLERKHLTKSKPVVFNSQSKSLFVTLF